MRDALWPDGYWRSARWVAAWLAAALLLAFSPFLVGPFTLLASAADAPSLYASGAALEPSPVRPLKELDPGGADWQSEAWLQIEHDALFVDHHVPWWDPYDAYGHPFAAAQPQQPFFPLTLLASVHPSPRVWDAYVVARLFVAGLFAGWFVLFYGGRFGALAAAAATSLGGYYLLYYSMPHLSVETLFPAVLWATEWLVRRPGLGAAAALGTVIGLLHLGGMPESTAVAVGAAFLYLMIRVRTSDPTAVPFGRIMTFAGANVLGAAIGAIMLVPFLEFLPLAIDTHRGNTIGLGFDGLPLTRAVFQRITPLAYGPPWNSIVDASGHAFTNLRGWFGATVAVGALIALFDAVGSLRRRLPANGPVIGLGVVAICALAKSIGAPWIQWIGYLPVLRLIVFPKYGEAVLDVSVAILGGFGVAALERRDKPLPLVVLGAFAVVAFVLTLGYRGTFASIAPGGDVGILYRSVTFSAAVLLAALAAALSARRAPGWTAALFAAVVGLEVVGNYYLPMYAHIAYIPPASRNPYAGAPYVRALHALTRDGRRVLGVGGPLWPSWAGAMRLDDPAALDAVTPVRYFTFVRAFLRPGNPANTDDLVNRFDASSDPSFATPSAQRWMTLSSLGFLVTPKGRTIGGAHLRTVYDDDVRIFAYDDPLPRASIFHRALLAADDAHALRMLTDPHTDVRTTLVLSEGAALDAAAQPGETAGETATIVRRDVASVEIDARVVRPGFLMLTDTYFPGWVATIDGAPAPILRANYMFRAIRVAAGRHRIVFSYRSKAAALGTALTLVGLVLVTLLGWFARRGAGRFLLADREREGPGEVVPLSVRADHADLKNVRAGAEI